MFGGLKLGREGSKEATKERESGVSGKMRAEEKKPSFRVQRCTTGSSRKTLRDRWAEPSTLIKNIGVNCGPEGGRVNPLKRTTLPNRKDRDKKRSRLRGDSEAGPVKLSGFRKETRV